MFRSTVFRIATVMVLAGGVAHAQKAPAAPAPSASAQKPQPAAAQTVPPPAEDPAPPRGSGQAINVRLELTITDARATGAPASKMISLLVSDRNNGRIRTSGDVKVGNTFRPITLNVDAQPEVLKDGRVRVQCNLEYRAQLGQGAAEENQPTLVFEQFNVILVNEKQTVVTQSADPASDRRVQVELKATVVK